MIILLVFCFYFFSPQAQAQSPADSLFQFDEVLLRGTGCPQGSTGIVLSPDQQTLSILFDQFQSMVPQTSGQNDNDDISDENPRRERRDNKQLNHKMCLMNFVAKIPVHYKIETLEISYDFRGFTSVERGTYAAFKSFLLEKKGLGAEGNGQKNLLINKQWKTQGEIIEDQWILGDTQSIKIHSRCARREERVVKIALKNILVTKILNRFRNDEVLPQALITLDSTDLKGKLVFKFRLKKCLN